MAAAFDTSTVLQHDIRTKKGRNLKIKKVTDSKTLFNVIIRHSSITDLRLMADKKSTVEAYIEGTINYFIGIRRA